MSANVERGEEFGQVCVWPGTLVGGDVDAFVKFMLLELKTRVVYLEEIETLPGKGGPGGRNDLFFAVHEDDIGRFTVPRLSMGIRWIEDAISQANGGNQIYPERIEEYRTWNLDEEDPGETGE